MLSTPNAAASGMVAMTIALPMFDATMIGSRRRRSTHTPRNRPGTIDGAMRAATSRPVSVAPAPSTNTAVSGSAISVIWLPSREMV